MGKLSEPVRFLEGECGVSGVLIGLETPAPGLMSDPPMPPASFGQCPLLLPCRPRGPGMLSAARE